MKPVQRMLYALLSTLVLVLGGTLAPAPAHAGPCEGNPWGCTGGRWAYVSYYEFQVQDNYYYCGPASTRLALTTLGYTYDQHQLGGPLLTDQYYETPDISQVTYVLNAYGNTGWYENKYIPPGYSDYHKNLLKSDIYFDILRNHVIVANVKGSAYDVDGVWHSYPDGHYLTIVGFFNDGDNAVIEDIAISQNGRHAYVMSLSQLTYWIATKGYSA